MRVASFSEIEPDFIERAHRMVWCDMATVGSDGRPRTRVVHPVWLGDTAWMTSLRVDPKAEDIDRNQSCRQNILTFRLAAGDTVPVALSSCAAD